MDGCYTVHFSSLLPGKEPSCKKRGGRLAIVQQAYNSDSKSFIFIVLSGGPPDPPFRDHVL